MLLVLCLGHQIVEHAKIDQQGRGGNEDSLEDEKSLRKRNP
jgi:hypothetical protein